MTLGAAGAAVVAVAQRHLKAEDLRAIATDTAVEAGLRDAAADGIELHQGPGNLDRGFQKFATQF